VRVYEPRQNHSFAKLYDGSIKALGDLSLRTHADDSRSIDCNGAEFDRRC
jgi:hypothetical protein